MISIHWKCRCLPAERTFEMRERDADEDVREWIDSMRRCLTAEHRQVSPLCQSVMMEYVKIPFHEGSSVGAAPPTKH